MMAGHIGKHFVKPEKAQIVHLAKHKNEIIQEEDKVR